VPLFAIIAMGWLANRLNLLASPRLAGLNGFTYGVALPALLFGSTAEFRSSRVLVVAGIYRICCILVKAIAMPVDHILLSVSLAGRGVRPECHLWQCHLPWHATSLGCIRSRRCIPDSGDHRLPLRCAASAGRLADRVWYRPSGRRGCRSAQFHCRPNAAPDYGIDISRLLLARHRCADARATAKFFALLGLPTTPLALFCLVASLTAITRRPAVTGEAALASALKWVALLLCVGGISWLMGLFGVPWRVAVVTAAMPNGANAFLLARRATASGEASAATVVVATAMSLFTITGLLSWLR